MLAYIFSVMAEDERKEKKRKEAKTKNFKKANDVYWQKIEKIEEKTINCQVVHSNMADI